MISSENRRNTAKVVKKRLKQIKGLTTYHHPFEDVPGKMKKKAPFGCSRANCHVCRKKKLKYATEYVEVEDGR